jgi:two-component SAPR family response regulator
MEEENVFRFMIVDDSELCITLYEAIIRKVIKKSQIKSFDLPQIALEYIKEQYDAEKKLTTLLFLDFHMPLMDGLEFLQEFAHLNQEIQEQFNIVIISSYTSKTDVKRAMTYPRVVKYIEKPFTIQVLKQLIGELGY